MDYESRSVGGQPYRLGRKLKAGSTGDVYETLHPLLPGPCAIKVLKPELVDRPGAFEAFRADVEAVSALRHPNVVHVIEVGAPPDPPFVVMELLVGRLLSERLAGHHTVPLDEAVEIVKSAAAALQAAHSRGIVHGEIHPANVFLVRVEGYDRPVVKLLNFGISRLRPLDAAAQMTADATRYLSPEQAAVKNEEIDGRTDQFALAMLAYRMLSGVDGFQGENAISLLYQIVHDGPAIERPPEVSRELEAVIRRGLARDKNQRFDTVVAFARAFESAARGEPGSAARSSTPAPVPLPEPVVPARAPGVVAARAFHPSPKETRTVRGFASSGANGIEINFSPRPPGREPTIPILPRQAELPPSQAPAARQPAPRQPAPAQRIAAQQQQGRPGVRVQNQRAQPGKVDSLLMEPFFDRYPDGEMRADTIDIHREPPPRASLHWLKLVFFLVAVGIASVAVSLAAGWNPPLSWRQSEVWNTLGLPGAASPPESSPSP